MRISNYLIIGLLAAGGFAATPHSLAADEVKKKDALTLISEMQVKQLTKNLTLTDEQQKKVQALYGDEVKRITVIEAQPGLDINQKYQKKVAIKKDTREQLISLLTPEQKTKLEEMNTKSSRRKKPAAPASP